MGAKAGMPVPDASLYIWDFGKRMEIPDEILEREDTQHLLLADLGQLETLTSRRSDSVVVMLKPATPFTFRAFVDIALKAWNLRQEIREARTLRHDRDALLQYVLEVNVKLQEHDQNGATFWPGHCITCVLRSRPWPREFSSRTRPTPAGSTALAADSGSQSARSSLRHITERFGLWRKRTEGTSPSFYRSIDAVPESRARRQFVREGPV